MRLYEAGLNGLCSPAMVGSSLVKALELVVAGETFLPAAIGLAPPKRGLAGACRNAPAVWTPPVAGSAARVVNSRGPDPAVPDARRTNKVIASSFISQKQPSRFTSKAF